MMAAGRATNGLCKFEWRDDGFFSAPRGKYSSVKGVAGDIEVVAEVLKRSGILSTSRPVYIARPNHEATTSVGLPTLRVMPATSTRSWNTSSGPGVLAL